MSTSSTSTRPTAVRVVPDLPGRGRSLVSTRTILAGEIILSELPILLYSPSPSSRHCSHCFRSLPSSPPLHHCLSCSTPFCSPLCLSLSSSSHTPWLCSSLSRLPPPLLSPDLRFLLSAYSLASISPSSFSLLLSLQGHKNPTDPLARQLHSTISALSPPPSPFGFDLDLTFSLLVKDRLNAFGLMDGADVRAYGIYPNTSFFNHDCLPNACRFDYVDGEVAGGRNTEIFVRAIHEIPEGREVCLSYFPVNWGFEERQRRLREDYGFACVCDRCEVEKNWKDDGNDDEEGGEESMEDEGMECVEEGDEGEGDGGDFPHAYFFVKFQCRREGCGGTLAPLPPSPQGAASDQMECNACGCIMKEEDEGGEGDAMLDV